jgi:hypothetical protein
MFTILKQKLISRRSAARPNLEISFDARRRTYTIVNYSGYESRNASTIHLFVNALESVKMTLRASFRVPVYTDDFVKGQLNRQYLTYCRSDEQTNAVVIPDHVFWGWPEVGIPDYDAMTEKILEASTHLPQDERLFWIGNPNTNPTRFTFLEFAAKHSDQIHGVGMGWVSNSNDPSTKALSSVNNTFVSLPDHCKYRFLIDLQARGYSGRLKLLMFSGRLLFVQDRPWKEYFHTQLKPFEHYLPVRADLSDLMERLDWARANPSKVDQIAKQAQEFAVKNLMRRNAIVRMADCLTILAGGQLSS